MIISVNWLKQFTEIDRPIEELVELIGSRLVEVEGVVDLGAKYKGVLLVDVLKVEKHPKADKLHVVHIDDGGAAKNVDRLEGGLVEVVCGAPNVREGMKAAWLPPGTTVPSTFGKDPLVLGARELRGTVSNGMLASERELAIGESHDGILDVDKDMPAGSPFAEAYELNDYLLDIENKSLTHRPDCFGLIGFAREVAAIQGKKFGSPDWLLTLEPVLSALEKDVEAPEIVVRIENAGVAPRYQLVALDNVNAALASPFAIQTWLARVGLQPINAVVDITNYLMYLTGQPLHAFDLDKVIAEHPEHKVEITVRESRQDEKLKLLDGRTIKLSSSDIVICSGDKPIALAGAMGGAATEIDSSTTRVLLESASFDLYRLRATQMRHGIFSEAATRFTKGQSPAQTAPVLASAARMISDIAGARRISGVIEEYPGKTETRSIDVGLEHANKLLGIEVNIEDAATVLMNAEFAANQKNTAVLSVRPPYWRADIHIAEDIIEEIGRLGGYDTITPKMPLRPYTAVMPEPQAQLSARVRQRLAKAGANEVLTYSFVPGKLLGYGAQDAEKAFRIVNAISPDLQYYRLSLMPSLLEKVRSNVKAGFDTFALFEINKLYNKLHLDGDGLPRENDVLGLAYVARKPARETSAAYYQARCYLDFLCEELGVELEYAAVAQPADFPIVQPYEPTRSALVSVRGSDVFLGIVGEFKESVRRAMKLPVHAAGFEIGMKELLSVLPEASSYKPLSRYPGTERDVTLKVTTDKPYGDAAHQLEKALMNEDLEIEMYPLDIYQDKAESGYKRISLRILLVNHEHTVTADEANDVVGRAAAAVVGAELI